MDKINVGIFFGGVSTEHEVSRRSAVHVITSLDRNKYDFTLFEVSKEGELFRYDPEFGSIDRLCKEIVKLDNQLIKNRSEYTEKIFTDNRIDVVFPVIHGTGGEDGVLQGFFELCGIPYVGSGVMGSALGFDKVAAKIVFEHYGIPQADYLCIESEKLDDDIISIKKEIAGVLNYPVFVKPANGGSSVGIYQVKREEDIESALRNASKYDRKIIIEKFVAGREFECAVLGGYVDIKVLGTGEIIPCNEFYDYNAKYVDEDSVSIIPAPIEPVKISEIEELAAKAFKAVDCYGLARIDFFMTDEGEIILNEINTMPGFTSISMYPKLWEAMNSSKSALITKLIELAFERKEKYTFLKDYCGETADE